MSTLYQKPTEKSSKTKYNTLCLKLYRYKILLNKAKTENPPSATRIYYWQKRIDSAKRKLHDLKIAIRYEQVHTPLFGKPYILNHANITKHRTPDRNSHKLNKT